MPDSIKKRAPELTVEDFERFPIWRYTDADEVDMDETVASPVTELPVSDLMSCLVGTRVRFNNGKAVSAFLANLSLDNPLKTKHLLATAISWQNTWFHLSDYFCADYEKNGPRSLAELFGLQVEEVFPIRYDISSLAVGPEDVVKGEIPAEPDVRLTSEQRIRLIVWGTL